MAMRNHLNKILLVLLLSAALNSCTSYKSQLFEGEGTVEQARMNAIIDFVNTYKTPWSYLKERDGKSFDIFWVYENEKIKNLYVFNVSPEIDENITLSIEDSLGEIPNSYFPNKFEVKEDKLFLWKDNVTPLRKEILVAVDGFGVLDSVDIKRELGLLPDDYVDKKVLTLDHSLKNTHYYICKNNIAEYKKVTTNKAFGYYDPPKLKCDSSN
jgi:hypothetical protein